MHNKVEYYIVYFNVVNKNNFDLNIILIHLQAYDLKIRVNFIDNI